MAASIEQSVEQTGAPSLEKPQKTPRQANFDSFAAFAVQPFPLCSTFSHLSADSVLSLHYLILLSLFPRVSWPALGDRSLVLSTSQARPSKLRRGPCATLQNRLKHGWPSGNIDGFSISLTKP